MTSYKNYSGEDRVVKSTEYAVALSKLPEEKRINFGITSVDVVTGGFAPGELIVATGYSGHGKTTFYQSISYNLAKAGMKLMWFSYELTAKQFFAKFPNPLPEFYMPKKNKPYSLDWIEERLVEGIEKHKVKAIFIDHLHYIVAMANDSGNAYTMIVGEAMRRLKQMAIEHKITVFLIAHTKQPNDSESPRLGSLRDSSFIAQEADAVYSVQRKRLRGSEEYEELTTFTVLKQRHLGTMGKFTKLEFHNGLLYDEIDRESEKAL